MKTSLQRKTIFAVLGVVLLIALMLWLGTIVEDSEEVQRIVRNFGYVGMLAVAAASGFNLLVPVPAIAFLPIFIAAGMNPVVSVAVIAVGMTIGDMIGFFIGKMGRKFAESRSLPDWLVRFETWLKERGVGVPIFLFLYSSIVPIPNEVVVIPAAAAGQKWTNVIIPLFFGHIIFNTLAALGITGIFELIR